MKQILWIGFVLLGQWTYAQTPLLFGAANAAFQVEGSPGDSDWLAWTKEKSRIRDGSNANSATDFWNRYDEDFTLAQKSGMNAFRISLAWDRIEPVQGKWDEKALVHYRTIIDAIKQHGMEPVVTLNHYVLPSWVAKKGGVNWEEFPKAFSRYALKAVSSLADEGKRVTYWMTFNEPMVLVRGGYLVGWFPPGHVQDLDGAVKAAQQMAAAHIEAVREIRGAKIARVKMSIAQLWQTFEPKTKSAADVQMAKTLDQVFNREFVDALVTGELNFSRPGAKTLVKRVDLPGGKSTLDYLGINVYGRSRIAKIDKAPYWEESNAPGPVNDLGWEIYPPALYLALKSASQYKLPMLISENGVADAKDAFRPKFLRDHFTQLERAYKEGLPLMGYLHWSLTDNFEWAFGLTPRFGLVEIDYTDAAKRKPRPSLSVYADLIKDFQRRVVTR